MIFAIYLILFSYLSLQVCDILFCFDTKTLNWETPETYGNIPGARDGHSAVIVGSKMFLFGGFEEASYH
jgi:hypothetical protein